VFCSRGKARVICSIPARAPAPIWGNAECGVRAACVRRAVLEYICAPRSLTSDCSSRVEDGDLAATGARAGSKVPTVKHVVICPSCAVNTRGSSRAHPCAVDAKHCTSLALALAPITVHATSHFHFAEQQPQFIAGCYAVTMQVRYGDRYVEIISRGVLSS
jgi:hypothetical protein